MTNRLRWNGAPLPSRAAWLAMCVSALLVETSHAEGGRVVREKIHGPSIEKNVTGDSPDRWVSVYLPPGYDKSPTKRYPTVYLLHAFGDTDAMWTTGQGGPYGNIQNLMDHGIAEGRFGEMILVMPDEHTEWFGSFYTNSAASGNWEDFTVKDLVAAIDTKYRTLARVESRGIGGFSMGGYGAIKLGMKHPDVFSVVYGMSPACLGWAGDLTLENPAFAKVARATTKDDLRGGGVYPPVIVSIARAFSPNPGRPPCYADLPFALFNGKPRPVEPAFSKWEENMPVTMARRYEANLRCLRGLRFDTAWDDEYTHIPLATRALARTLTDLGIEFTFEEYNGDHRNRRWGRTGRFNRALLPYFWMMLETNDPAANESARDDRRRQQGDWQLASARRDGKDMPADTAKIFRCKFHDDRFSITREGKVVESGTLRLDPSGKPKAIDFILDGGDGQQVLGIYEFEGDTYRICYGGPGKDRPTTFDAAAGSGHSFSAWKRLEKERPKPSSPPRPSPTEPLKELKNSIGMELIRIPSGEFDMGSHEPARELADAFKIDVRFVEFQYPLHHVRISQPFFLGKCEVTVGQFRAFVKDTGYRTQAESDVKKGSWGYDAGKMMLRPEQRWVRKPELTWTNPGFPQTDEHPVVHVSWNDAKAFCDWLSRKEKRTYRLPTEAEWEYACRAGTTTRFSTGDALQSLKGYANVADRSAGRKFSDWPVSDFDDGYVFTAPVATFKANAFGLHDMHGNVWEWVADWGSKEYYSKSPASDPVNDAPGTDRVIRGGGWDYYVGGRCESACRAAHAPSSRYDYLGFRVVTPPTDG
jgi:uncharacterized protein (TIGR03067 family)